MSFRATTQDTFNRFSTHPELFLIGAAISVSQAILLITFELGVSTIVSLPRQLHIITVSALSFIFTLPLFVGLYTLSVHPDAEESSTESLRRALQTTISRYTAVLQTDILVIAVSGAIGLLTGLTWFVVATGGRYIRYLASDPAAPYPLETVYLVGAAVFLGGLFGSFIVRFADILTAFQTDSASSAVKHSATAARQHPLSFVSFAVVVGTIQLATLGVLSAVDAALLPGSTSLGFNPIDRLLLVSFVNSITLTLVGTLHGVFADHTIIPSTSQTALETRPFLHGVTPTRMAFVVILIASLVSGAVVVRTIDPGVHSPPEIQSITTEDPDAAVNAAVTNTMGQSHRQVLYMRNATDTEDSFVVFQEVGVDYADRQQYTYFRGNEDEKFGGFFGEGTMALLRAPGRYHGITTYTRGEWGVMMFPAWDLTDGAEAIAGSMLPSRDIPGWTVVSSNASTVVVRLTDPEAIRRAVGSQSFNGMAAPMANDSSMTVSIERETGVLTDVYLDVRSMETGRHFEYHLEYQEVGTADLQRPQPIQDRELLEWVWDAIYY